jgi:hypothetical protein
MSFWNYRVVRYADGAMAVHEVYYDDNGSPEGRQIDPATFYSDADEGLDGLVRSLERALANARENPILEDAVFDS